MRAIAQSLSRRPSNYLLLGTKDYNQLMLVNPRVNFEAIAYPSIILVSKAKPENHFARVLNWEVGQSIDTFSSVFKQSSFLILQKELTPDGWRLESPAALRLLDKLRAAGTPLVGRC